METTIVVLFAVVVLAMLALIWLLRLFFKNYPHRSEGAAFRDVAGWEPPERISPKPLGSDIDLDWTKL